MGRRRDRGQLYHDNHQIGGVVDVKQFKHHIMSTISRRPKYRPLWCEKDELVETLLTRRFPKRSTNARQLDKAREWQQIIYHYMRCGRQAWEVVRIMRGEDLQGQNGPNFFTEIGKEHRRRLEERIHREAQIIRFFARGLDSKGRPFKIKVPTNTNQNHLVASM
jgi:hypothetical protein